MDNNLNDLLNALTGFSSQKMEDIGPVPFIIVMLISLMCAMFVSLLYVRFYKVRSTGSQVHRAFPLLGISVTAIFICIQFSLPLSLGLLGALSIVRFRTPIKEPEEIGFIMLVIAASLCCATFNMLFLAIILAVALLAVIALNIGHRLMKSHLNDGMIIVTLPSENYREHKSKIIDLLEKAVPKGRLDSISENEHESIVSYSFVRLNKNTLLSFQDDLTDISSQARSNVFFNNSGHV